RISSVRHCDRMCEEKSRCVEGVERHVRPGIEALAERADVDGLVVRPEGPDRHRVRGRVPAKLAGLHVDRHLAALESCRHLVRAGPRLLALDPTTRVASLPGAQAAADPRAVLARLRTPQ